ncbi:MAG: magnesium transporter [bacterium]|nr:magnesium transporter [bacterium]
MTFDFLAKMWSELMHGSTSAQNEDDHIQRQLPIEAVRRLLRRDAYPNLVRSLHKFHGSECAAILQELTLNEQIKLIERLPDLQLVTTLFTFVGKDTRARLLPHLSTARLVDIIRLIPPDDATDILGDMPPGRLQEMLDQLPEPIARDISKLLSYHPQSAGGIMTPNFFALLDTTCVSEAMDTLRSAGQAETVFYIYVVDAKQRLVGVVSLRQLVMAKPDAILRGLMEIAVLSVNIEEDQEQIANLITQYDFLALPVVDHSQRLVGIVTVDDIIDVISEEATEDMLRIAGVNPDEMLDVSSRRTIRHRLPWLFVSWLGGLMASYIIESNQEAIQTMVVLAAYFPVIIGMGGNAATQSLAVAVRGLATGTVDPRFFGQALLKEGRIGLSLGAIYGLLLGTVVVIWQNLPLLGLVVGVAIWASMTIAAVLGGLLPLIFARWRIDPAVASGPFLTTAIDVIGLVIYLGTAKMLLL